MSFDPATSLPGYVLASDGNYYPPNEFPPGTVEPDRCARCDGSSGSLIRDVESGLMVHRDSCSVGNSLLDVTTARLGTPFVGPSRSGVLAPMGHRITPLGPDSVPLPDVKG